MMDFSRLPNLVRIHVLASCKLCDHAEVFQMDDYGQATVSVAKHLVDKHSQEVGAILAEHRE